MPYQLTGILKLPDGTPAANVDIEFVSQANYSPLVRDLSNTIRTGETGSYSVELEYGEYSIRLLYASAYPLHPGKIYVYADTPAGQDLPTLMQAANWTPATPDYIVQIQNWLVEAKAAHDGAMESAAEAKASELAAKASEVAVEADRAEVAANKTSVSASQADVTAKQADVTAKAAQVASDKAAAEAAKVAAVAASDTASQKAVLAAESSALAQDAATRAEQSAQALVGALIDAGSYNAASGVLPAPVSVAGSERSCVWKVTGSGVAGGIELGVGDSLVYTTSDSSYYKIDNTESVTSVNGKKGVVSITASDVGADPSGTSSDAITQHEAKAGAHSIAGVNGLQAALDSKEASGAATAALAAHKIGINQHSISGVTGLQSALDSKETSGTASSLVTPLAARVTALEARKFTTLIPATYPSGAPHDTHETVDAALPANIAVNTRYVLTNPFGIDTRVHVTVEVWANNKWTDPGFDGSAGTQDTSGGVVGHYVQGEGVVVQTGSFCVAGKSSLLGGGHGYTGTQITSAPCRVAVRKWEE